MRDAMQQTVPYCWLAYTVLTAETKCKGFYFSSSILNKKKAYCKYLYIQAW